MANTLYSALPELISLRNSELKAQNSIPPPSPDGMGSTSRIGLFRLFFSTGGNQVRILPDDRSFNIPPIVIGGSLYNLDVQKDAKIGSAAWGKSCQALIQKTGNGSIQF